MALRQVRWRESVSIRGSLVWKLATKKVKHFIKTTGAQDAKFGLEAVETAGEAAGKVASFIPAVGEPANVAIQEITQVAGMASNGIHVKLPGKLQTGMNIMNDADQIINNIPRRREFSEEEVFPAAGY